MEYPACAICRRKTNEVEIGTRGERGSMVRNVMCLGCGLIFISPRIPEAEITALYRHGDEAVRSVVSLAPSRIQAMRQYAGKVIRVLPFLLGEIEEGAHVLEFGSGYGDFLKLCRDAFSADARGVEPDAEVARIGSTLFGVRIDAVAFNNFFTHLVGEMFDMILLHHVFEHFYNPRETLRQLKQLLAPGGIVYIEVPNTAGFKKEVDEFFKISHPYSYTPYTLNRLLNEEGLKIIKIEGEREHKLRILATHFDDPRRPVAAAALMVGFPPAKLRRMISRKRFLLGGAKFFKSVFRGPLGAFLWPLRLLYRKLY